MSIYSEIRNDSDKPYETQVRLAEGETGYTSSGYLEVYIHESWGPVCHIGSHDADSACRQLGYTNAEIYSSGDSQ